MPGLFMTVTDGERENIQAPRTLNQILGKNIRKKYMDLKRDFNKYGPDSDNYQDLLLLIIKYLDENPTVNKIEFLNSSPSYIFKVMGGYIDDYYPPLDYRKYKSADDKYYKIFHINKNRIIYLSSCNSTRKKYNIDEYTDYKEDCLYGQSYNSNFRLSNGKYIDMINTMIFNLVKNTDGDKNETLGINFKIFQNYPILTYKMVESRGIKKSFWGKEKNVMIPRHITEEESNEIHNRYAAIGEELKKLTENEDIKPAEPAETKAELLKAAALESAEPEPAEIEPASESAALEPAELEPAVPEPAALEPAVGGKRRKRATKKRKTKSKGKRKTRRAITKRKTRR